MTNVQHAAVAPREYRMGDAARTGATVSAILFGAPIAGATLIAKDAPLLKAVGLSANPSIAQRIARIATGAGGAIAGGALGLAALHAGYDALKDNGMGNAAANIIPSAVLTAIGGATMFALRKAPSSNPLATAACVATFMSGLTLLGSTIDELRN